MIILHFYDNMTGFEIWVFSLRDWTQFEAYKDINLSRVWISQISLDDVEDVHFLVSVSPSNFPLILNLISVSFKYQFKLFCLFS